MLEQGVDHCLLDVTGIDRFAERFPTIAGRLVEVGLDPTRDLLPIAPAAHYLCGGVVTDLDGATALPGLWAAGEVACSGCPRGQPARLQLAARGPGLRGSGGRRRGRRPRRPERHRGHAQRARADGESTAAEIGGRVLPVRLPASLERHRRWPAGTGVPDEKEVAAARDRLQRAMTAGAGVVRDAGSLARTAEVVEEVAGVAGAALGTRHGEELANLCTMATALLAAASARGESRGAHTRLDAPEHRPGAGPPAGGAEPRPDRPAPPADRRWLAAGADAGQACSVPRAVHPPRVVVVEAVTRALAEDLDPARRPDLGPAPRRPGGHRRVRRPPPRRARRSGVRHRDVPPDRRHRRAGLGARRRRRRRPPARCWPPPPGPLASILTAERTALNFLGHLSGIATHTRAFVDTAATGGTARIWDTRKTTPGLRSLEKAAVRAGGGANHRGNLSDWILLKDNHIALFGITDAVARAHAMWPARTVHVECDRLDQVQEALAAGADALLLDNMTPDEVRACVAAAEAAPRRPLLEVSGGVTLDTVASYAGTGVDCISVGGLTNAAPVLDIGLDIEPG